MAMIVDWSTQAIAPARRFEHWREACCQHIYALTPERRARDPFEGSLRRRCVGPLDVADIRCDGHVVQRRPQDIDAHPSSTCYLYAQRQGRAWFEQRGTRHVVEAGDIVIADPDVAFSTGADGRFDFRLWRIDRGRLAPLRRHGDRELPMVRLGAARGETALLAGWLDVLLDRAHALNGPALQQAFDTLCALVADCADAAPDANDAGRAARRQAELQRVRRHVAQRSNDPGLTARQAARELAMSLRKLHQLFEGADESFHESVTSTRLAHAHAMLRDPARRALSVADVGWAAGFADTSTFYRRFRQRYGMAPGDARDD
jgi:AraC-like DNA-binding protein